MIIFSNIVKLSVESLFSEFVKILEQKIENKNIKKKDIFKDLNVLEDLIEECNENNFNNSLYGNIKVHSNRKSEKNDLYVTFQDEKMNFEVMLVLKKDRNNNFKYDVSYSKVHKKIFNNINLTITYQAEEITSITNKNENVSIDAKEVDIKNIYHQILCHQKDNGNQQLLKNMIQI